MTTPDREQALGGWQNMDDAPKDGRFVWILSDEEGTRNPVSLRQWRAWQHGSSNPTFEDHWVDEIGQIRRSLRPIGWKPVSPPAPDTVSTNEVRDE